MTNTTARRRRQIGIGERVVEDDSLREHILNHLDTKEKAAFARENLKELIEERPDLRGEFRVGEFQLKVTQRISFSIKYAPRQEGDAEQPTALDSLARDFVKESFSGGGIESITFGAGKHGESPSQSVTITREDAARISQRG